MKNIIMLAIFASCSCLLAKGFPPGSDKTTIAVAGHPEGCTCKECIRERKRDGSSQSNERSTKKVSQCMTPKSTEDEEMEEEEENGIRKTSMPTFVQNSRIKIALA